MDKNAGKYNKFYKEEFELASAILKAERGHIEWSTYDYQAFTFKKPMVSLVFYPHKTSAGNYHIRVRNQGSKDKDQAERIMKMLYKKSGHNCTFS